MTSRALCLIGALLAAAAPARAQGDPRALESRAAELERDAGRALSDLERAMRALRRAKLFEGRPLGGWIDSERARGYCSANPWPLEEARGPLRLYYMCEALVRDDPAVCEGLGPQSRESIFQKFSDCVRGYWHLKLAREVIAGGADIESVCKSHVDFTLQFSPLQLDELCPLLRKADPKPLCEAIRDRYPSAFHQPDLATCLVDNEIFWGTNKPSDCEEFGSTGYQFLEEQVCIAASRFRRARALGPGGSCGDSVLCHALQGDAPACDAYLAGLRSQWCRVLGPSDSPGNADPRQKALAAEAAAALAATDGRPMGPTETAAARRLNAMMTREAAIDVYSAVPDILLLRAGAVGDLESRGETLCQAISVEVKSCAARRARLSALKARALAELADFGRRTRLPLDTSALEGLFDQ